MKKYALLIAIGSLFLGTGLQAMDSSNIDRYKSFLQSKLIAQASDMYEITPYYSTISRTQLNRKAKEIKDYAKNLNIDYKTALNMIVDTIIDGIVYYSLQRIPYVLTTDKAYVKRTLEPQIKIWVENAFNFKGHF